MVTEKNKIISKAEEKRKYSTGEAERERLQELREKAEFDEATAYSAGKAKGEKSGIKIGRKTTLLETAQSMLKDNMDINMIIKYTGLSKKDLEQITL